ncbi:RNA polymerase sigma factor [Streptomyces sp. ACA25]|uniref:RNA polymerase sigma factor n=1 Tax=Streptomyces sp. ACA25 TaxID=3022596 RepID=UPI002307F741|nr:RNA polymerase sigma factor [Streptomyces sp. ACA25]MDB1087067.1 RNA polymerase sigma factor [Streptomyces sp. ACA25]
MAAKRGGLGLQGADSELTAAVRAAQKGEEAAFVLLFRRLHPGLLRYVRSIVADPDAEDVAAETWLHIARDLDGFHGDADRFRGWTTRIARNRALDHVRARSRRPVELTGDSTLLELVADTRDTAEEAIAAVGTARAVALVSMLPAEQADAVMLRTLLGLDARRAALVLGCRPGAVRTATHRGLRRLARMLEDQPEPGGLAGCLSASALRTPEPSVT